MYRVLFHLGLGVCVPTRHSIPVAQWPSAISTVVYQYEVPAGAGASYWPLGAYDFVRGGRNPRCDLAVAEGV